MNLLILIYCVFFTFLAVRRLDWSVILLVVALPSYLIRFQIFGVPFTLLEAMILISFAVWFIFHTEFRNFIKNKYGWRDFKENRKKRRKYPFRWEIILFLIISYIAVAVAGFSNSALGVWKAYFFEPLLVFILVLNVFCKPLQSPEKDCDVAKSQFSDSLFCIGKILWPLAISSFIVSVFAIYQKFTGALIPNELWAAEETRRVTSFFGYPNAVGQYLGPMALIMMGWLVNKIFNFSAKGVPASGWQFLIFPPKAYQPLAGNFQTLKMVFIGLTIILSILSIYFAKSEGALIAVAAGFVLFGLLAGRKIRLATVILILIIGTGMMIYQPAHDYAVKKLTLHDLSGQIRRQQWKETREMLKDGRIITGAGLANYQKTIKPYHQEGIFFNKDNDPDFRRKIVLFNEKYKSEYWQPVEIYLYPHNILLNFWTELGLAGMLLFVWIIGKYFVMGIKNYKLRIMNSESGNKYLIIGLMCSMAVIVIHGLVDVPYFKNDLAVIFWLLVAMMSLVNLRRGGRAVEGAALEKP